MSSMALDWLQWHQRHFCFCCYCCIKIYHLRMSRVILNRPCIVLAFWTVLCMWPLIILDAFVTIPRSFRSQNTGVFSTAFEYTCSRFCLTGSSQSFHKPKHTCVKHQNRKHFTNMSLKYAFNSATLPIFCYLVIMGEMHKVYVKLVLFITCFSDFCFLNAAYFRLLKTSPGQFLSSSFCWTVWKSVHVHAFLLEQEGR